MRWTTEREEEMSYHALERRFGITAVDKGFITAEQLIEAMTVQIREELGQRRHRPIGQILVDLGYLNPADMRGVFSAMGFKGKFLDRVDKSEPESVKGGMAWNPSSS